MLRPWLSRRLRSHCVLTGRLRGARLVTSWHDYPAGIIGLTERALLDWFHEQVEEGMTWLDIGAHYGYTAIALSRLVGNEGRVFAFEPVVATAGCLARTRALNGLTKLTIVPSGLGSPETLTLKRLPTVRGMAEGRSVGVSESSCETIQLARFDWLWPQINDGQSVVNGVKIDVQGMELDVLRGMRQTLSEQRPALVIELHEGVSRPAVLDLLRSYGYSSTAIAVEPAANEVTPLFLDDRSYAFLPA